MSSSFHPPPEDQLAEADLADCAYRSELSEIIGVVSPECQGGWPRSDRYEIHTFDLAAWRHVDSDELQSELTILRPVPVDSDYFADYEEGGILRIRVLLSVDATRAIVAEVIDENIDAPKLEAIAIELAKPVEIDTELVGRLVLDRRINWFWGTVTWNGKEVRISFAAEHGLDIANQLETARALLDAELEWQGKIEAFAVREKLPLANDWRESGEQPITEQEFLDRMELESISIQSDGKFEFWHSDGGLFCGHSIQISGSLKQGLTQSDIPG